MPSIKVLPENLINQIAAGEVVERPASVVKELVENSLDAGAERIIVEVHGGGDTFLRVTDDGKGMDKDDALLCFERHATSKISTAEDLVNIHTLGFRGEAIASIASVSNMIVQTKKKGAMEGSLLMSEGGRMTKMKELGCPEGTQIEVRDLFFNTPARKKYLKSDAAEYRAIVDLLTGIALANPSVAIKLVHDDKVVFDLAATENVQVRIRDLMGRQVADNLIPVFNGHAQMKLEGFIGKPDIARANRKGQHLFVNGREVSSYVLSYAVKQAFHSLLPNNRHPVFVFFLYVDPKLVDVNVQRWKRVVRFSDEKAIFRIFVQATKHALEKHVLAPDFNVPVSTEQPQEREHQTLKSVNVAPPVYETVKQEALVLKDEPEERFEQSLPGQKSESEKSLPGENSEPRPNALERDETVELKPLAHMNLSYILCQQVSKNPGEGAHANMDLVVLDQHAAHERIRYTELVEQFEKKDISTQPLLVPVQLELSLSDKSVLEENLELLKGLGFEVEPFGGNTFSVYGVPSSMVKEDPSSLIQGILDDLSNQSVKGDFQARKEKALIYASCRSAVKFGDELSMPEMEALCSKLMTLELPYTCPHGRPTMVRLSAAELEKRFGRDYKS